MARSAVCARQHVWQHVRVQKGHIALDEAAAELHVFCLQASLASMAAFVIGAGIPLLAAAFIHNGNWRLISLSISSTFALIVFGAIGAALGGANLFVVGSVCAVLFALSLLLLCGQSALNRSGLASVVRHVGRLAAGRFLASHALPPDCCRVG